MTRRQLRYEEPPREADPFGGCCWPKCESLPHKSDFWCPVHEHQVPNQIDTAMHGAVAEGDHTAWRAALRELELHIEKISTG